jgi:hypothetical protein
MVPDSKPRVGRVFFETLDARDSPRVGAGAVCVSERERIM